jgi:hypothetical protein
VGFENWLFDQNEEHYIQTGRDFNDNEIEWMEAIYNEYADDEGFVDWTDHDEDSAWWIYMSEIVGLDDDQIEQYA